MKIVTGERPRISLLPGNQTSPIVGERFSSSQKISRITDTTQIKKVILKSSEQAAPLDEEKMAGLFTNTLQELLKVTEQLKEVQKQLEDSKLTQIERSDIQSQASTLATKFNKIVASQQFKRASKMVEDFAASSQSKADLVKGIDHQLGDQGEDMKGLAIRGGASAFRSLADLYHVLEESRVHPGDLSLLRLERHPNGEVNPDLVKASKSDETFTSLSNRIGQGLESLAGPAGASDEIEKTKTEAAHSIASLVEQTKFRSLQNSKTLITQAISSPQISSWELNIHA